MSDVKHRKLVQAFYENVEMPGGWSFNQPEKIKLIDRFYNSEFKNGKYDKQGFRKFFYNIVKPTCDIATKFIDLDTRDIILTPEHNNDELRVFLMQRRLKQWLKDSEFAKFLNEITHTLPIYGHVVAKKTKEGWMNVPIQNLRNHPNAKGIVTDDFAEVYSMYPSEMREFGWDTENLNDDEEYLVYDCFMREGKTWKRLVKTGLWDKKHDGGIRKGTEAEINTNGEWAACTTLFEETLTKHKYREIKWENVPGRAMGRGFVEYLEDNQIARNETENLERKAHAVNSLVLFQTRDEEIAGKNVLTNNQNGDILRQTSEVTPIATESRNQPQFQGTRQNWDLNTERKTFTSDITTGASLPSRTPLGVANQQAAMAASFFERKREEIGLFIKQLLIEDQIPAFVKDTQKEHTMIFSCADEESSYLGDAITEAYVGDAIVKYTNKTGFHPSKEQKELLRMQVMDKLKGKKNRFLKIPDGYWTGAKYMVDINITGESSDVSVKSQLIQMVLQIQGTNPAVLQDPNSRSLIFALLSLGGINPTELGLTYQSQSQPMMPPQIAGSMAAPRPMAGTMQSMQQV